MSDTLVPELTPVPATAPNVEVIVRCTSWWALAWRHRGLIVASLFVLALVALAFIQPFQDPRLPDTSSVLKGPSGEHWLGTEQNGFDLFSRLIAAARTDIPLAFGGAAIAGLIGTPLGLWLSLGGRAGSVFMRLLDLVQSLPLVVVALTVVALAGSGALPMLTALTLVNVATFIRLSRAEAMAVRTHRFVEAAQAMGASQTWVSLRHVLPNIGPVMFAELSLSAGHNLLTIAGLGFLGVGVEPTTPSWGVMLNQGSQFLGTGQWWALIFPIAAVVISVLSFNTIARGLSAVFDRSNGGHR